MGELSWLVLARRVLETLLRQQVKKWNRKQSFKIFILHLIRVDAEFYRSEDSSDFYIQLIYGNKMKKLPTLFFFFLRNKK